MLGEPSPGQLEAFSIFSEAQQAAQDLIKPGINASDAARAQNDVFRKYGYGDYTGAKYTRVRGHCLGLFPDETPHILEDVDYVIKENMVLIAHPNTYLPLSGYMVFGDSLLVTASGNVRLNTTEKKLFVKEAWHETRIHRMGSNAASAGSLSIRVWRVCAQRSPNVISPRCWSIPTCGGPIRLVS